MSIRNKEPKSKERRRMCLCGNVAVRPLTGSWACQSCIDKETRPLRRAARRGDAGGMSEFRVNL